MSKKTKKKNTLYYKYPSNIIHDWRKKNSKLKYRIYDETNDNYLLVDKIIPKHDKTIIDNNKIKRGRYILHSNEYNIDIIYDPNKPEFMYTNNKKIYRVRPNCKVMQSKQLGSHEQLWVNERKTKPECFKKV